MRAVEKNQIGRIAIRPYKEGKLNISSRWVVGLEDLLNQSNSKLGTCRITIPA